MKGKKILNILLIIAVAILLTACGNKVKTVNINKTKEIQFHELKLELPDVYEKSNQSTEDIEFYSIDDINYDLSTCTIYVSTGSTYGSIQEDIDFNLGDKYFQSYQVQSKTVNNHEWLYAVANSKETDNGGYYTVGVYYTDYNNTRYQFEFTNYYPEKRDCSKMIEKITNSFRFE